MKNPEIIGNYIDSLLLNDLNQPFVAEFPAVLINLKSGRILDEFHAYVRPSEVTQLSEFCIQLTGIRQSQIDSSDPLNKVLTQFHDWLKRMITKYRLVLPKTSPSAPLGNTIFVTWSDWDFGVCLQQECQRKRLTLQGYFNQWMDLRALYRVRNNLFQYN